MNYPLEQGALAQKIVIGAAFYFRAREGVDAEDNGRCWQGVHAGGVLFREVAQAYGGNNDFEIFWDNEAEAPYAYSRMQKH